MTGTGDRTRTGKPVKAGDFESPVSTNSTTPAEQIVEYSNGVRARNALKGPRRHRSPMVGALGERWRAAACRIRRGTPGRVTLSCWCLRTPA